ncbi:TPA: hypothetical protein EYP13_02340, partial [Candidatus Micrarchaeota archaeon]|nr:hypothetical protein [Candidatus Micrarchaeota archaeon]
MTGAFNNPWLIALLLIAAVAFLGGGDFGGLHQTTTEVQVSGEGESKEVKISQEITAQQWPLKEVRMEFVSALDPRKHIDGIHVEILPVGEVPNDPMRTKVDQAEVNNGYAVFTAGKIEVGKSYLLAVNGKDIAYDKTKTVTIPMLPPQITEYTFTNPEKVVPVAHFADINVDTQKDVTFDISGESGVNYKTITIRIAVSDNTPEGAIKNPVLVMKTDDDNPLAPGAIVHIYATRLQGTDFGVPAVDLAGYFANETPIAL